jgi:hypothetical protein
MVGGDKGGLTEEKKGTQLNTLMVLEKDIYAPTTPWTVLK